MPFPKSEQRERGFESNSLSLAENILGNNQQFKIAAMVSC